MGEPDDRELLSAYATQESEEAFSVLVQRHIGLVYSSALRQVRDPHLAEEVTQAVFVLLARKAKRLRREAVLAGWLCRAARLTAYSSIRAEHRRRKRDQEAYMDSLSGKHEPDVWVEMMPLLDEAVAQLGGKDRDALVLRYYERKPLDEVGKLLGLKVDAAQKRVSRALEKLRRFFSKRGVILTTTAIAGAISANAVQAAPVGLGATVSTAAAKGVAGAAALGVCAKLVSMPGKLLCLPAALLPVIGSLPSLALMALIGRSERRNFRDVEGFRPRLHRGFFRSFVWGFPIVALAFAVLSQSVAAAWGYDVLQWSVAAFLLALTAISARSLVVSCNRHYFGMFVFGLILSVSAWCVALGWISQDAAQFAFWLAAIAVLLSMPQRPARMDYSLFLRAAQGMLRESAYPEQTSATGNRMDRRSLLRFARFLGARFLVANFRWQREGLALCLPRVRSNFIKNMAGIFLPPLSGWYSIVVLGRDGTVRARCGEADAGDLRALGASSRVDPSQVEEVVANAVGQAWRAYRAGGIQEAEARIGHVPDSEVFVIPPTRARSLRWMQVFFTVLIVAGLSLSTLALWLPAWLSHMSPVSITEAEVRQFLDDTTPSADPRRFRRNSAGAALFSCLVLPSTNLFSPRGLEAMRSDIAGSRGFDSMQTQETRVHWLLGTPLARRAFAAGWLAWADLNVEPGEAATFLREERPDLYSKWDCFLTRRQAWSWLRGERTEVLRIDSDGLARIQLLNACAALGIVDREALIKHIGSAQVLSGRSRGLEPKIENWRAVRGLFFTPCFPALQDTYFSLAALEALGGLDRIDREACIRGILRRHSGRGFFTSPTPGGFNEFHIDGSARDTIAAYESLRILRALDRVMDLEDWQFRVRSRRSANSDDQGLTWEQVEAWVCERRLKEIVSERKKDPQQPFRSLLELLRES